MKSLVQTLDDKEQKYLFVSWFSPPVCITEKIVDDEQKR
jgi:hypothetical protein